MAKVWSYIRFSTKKQIDGDSLRRQLESSDEWIRRNGHTLGSTELHDLGRSGYHARHLKSPSGKLKLFLEMIQDGRVQPGDILLVEALDRLSRQEYTEAEKIFRSILDAGVVIAVLKPYEAQYTKEAIAKDPMALTVPLMGFHLAFLESKGKADRLRKAWDHKRADAAKQGPKYKFDKRRSSWLDWDERKKDFVVNKWAAAVAHVFDATAQGHGQRRVLAELVEKFPGRRWNSSFIQKVLSDRAVLGERQPKTSKDGKRIAVGAAIANYYPRIVSDETWTRAMAAKSNNKKHRGPHTNFVNLFTGLLHNAHDGSAMHVVTTRGQRVEGVHLQRRLVSYNHSSKVAGADPVSVPYFQFEKLLLKHLSELRADDLNSTTGVSELRAKEQELQGVELRLQRLEADMAEADDEGEYQSLRNAARLARGRRDELKAEVEKLNQELHAGQPLAHAHDLMKVLETSDDAQRHVLRLRLRSLIAELVASVYLKPEKHFGRVYTLVQVTYRSGLIRQMGFGPGWITTGSAAGECPAYGLDLRNMKACQKPKLKGLARMLSSPAPAPKVTKVPNKVGAAADLFLRVRKSEMAKQSYRVVPAKIRRFVEFVGADTLCKDVTAKDWKVFVRTLKNEVTEKKLQKATARVAHNRVRELLKWLVEQGVMAAFDFGGSAVKALGN